MRKLKENIVSEMENDIATAPSKKRKTEIDYRYCITCQQHLGNEKTLATPLPESTETILKRTREWHQNGDMSETELVMRTKEGTFQDICDVNATYNRTYYKNFSNKTKINCGKERYEKSLIQ